MKIFIIIFVVTVIGNVNIDGACAGRCNSFRGCKSVMFMILPAILDQTLTSDSGFTPDAVIHQLFELLRNLIRNGSIEHQIPILDPYYLQNGNFYLNDEIFRVDLNVTNATLRGLGKFYVQRIDFSKTDIAIELNVNWPLLTFYTDYYNLEGSIKSVLPLLGHGIMNIELYAFELRGQMYLKPSSNGKSILIDSIKNPHYSIEKVKSRTEIDGNIDTIFNAMVEDLLAGYLTRFSKFLAARYSDDIIQHLNPILDKFDSWNMIVPIL